MSIKIDFWLESDGIQKVYAWVDADGDGQVSEQEAIELNRTDNRWSGSAVITAPSTQRVVLMWKVTGTIGAPYKQDILDQEGRSILTDSSTGNLIAVKQRIFGVFRGAE